MHFPHRQTRRDARAKLDAITDRAAYGRICTCDGPHRADCTADTPTDRQIRAEQRIGLRKL